MKPAQKRLAWLLFVNFGAVVALYGFWSVRARLGLPLTALVMLLLLIAMVIEWLTSREPDD